jgi:multidrug efflux system membrane fusion protein
MQLSNETASAHEGVIDFVDNRIDPNTGTMRARGVFPNPNGWFTPGLFARMRVPGSGRYRATLVPDAAVGTDQNQRFLLLVKEDDTVERRVITLGHLFDGMRAIEEGVTTQDRIVINGLQRAMPGSKVKPEEVVLPNEPLVPGSAATQALPATRNLLDPGAATAPSAPATRSASTPVPTTGGAQ